MIPFCNMPDAPKKIRKRAGKVKFGNHINFRHEQRNDTGNKNKNKRRDIWGETWQSRVLNCTVVGDKTRSSLFPLLSAQKIIRLLLEAQRQRPSQFGPKLPQIVQCPYTAHTDTLHTYTHTITHTYIYAVGSKCFRRAKWKMLWRIYSAI